MQRIGCCKLDPARDFPPGRDAAANARVGRQRKGWKAFRRQKLDLGTQLAGIGGKRLQAPYDPVDLRRPCVGCDQYSHRARAAQDGSRISGLPIRMTAPISTDSQRATPCGANTMMVDPCWNHPISCPLLKEARKCDGSNTGRPSSYLNHVGTIPFPALC